jgi:hypothetical protein
MAQQSNPVNDLLCESLSGKISRREVLKRATALGLSAPLVGLLVSAHSRGALAQDARPTEQSPAPTLVKPTGPSSS